MIDVEKFVQNMLKHFTWVSFLLSFLKVRMLIISVLWCELSQFVLGFFSLRNSSNDSRKAKSYLGNIW
jgi:hypothetical protein